jgi:hypothetical protein
VNNVTHLVSKRCPVTRLTKLQIAALANVCLGVSEHMPNGVYRSLVIRGLLTSTHADCGWPRGVGQLHNLVRQVSTIAAGAARGPGIAKINKVGGREIEPSRLRIRKAK